jgi:8-oxo-dGTP diphosphatase
MTLATPIALALVWKRDRLLVAKRLANSHQAGIWEFPGGRIEALESPESAAVREVEEELGVQCLPVARRANFCFEYPDRKLQFFPVDCAWVSGEPSAMGALHPRWVMQSEIAHYDFPPANRKLLLELQARWGRRSPLNVNRGHVPK